MSIDILQEKIRKLKNPSMVELMLPLTALPPRYAHDAKGYGEFCRDLLGGLKGIIPAVRLSFGVFALLGGEGLQELAQTLNTARNMGYYTVLDAPELLSPTAARMAAEALFGGGGAMTDVPTVNLTAEQANAKLIDVLTAAKVFSSKREARQMVQQGGLYIGDTAVSDAEMQLSPEMFDADKSLLVRKGKKKYYRLLID